jgi:hypothetical protein
MVSMQAFKLFFFWSKSNTHQNAHHRILEENTEKRRSTNHQLWGRPNQNKQDPSKTKTKKQTAKIKAILAYSNLHKMEREMAIPIKNCPNQEAWRVERACKGLCLSFATIFHGDRI